MFFNKSPFYTADYKVYDRLAPYIMNENWSDFWHKFYLKDEQDPDLP